MDTDCRKEGNSPFFFCVQNCRQAFIEDWLEVIFSLKKWSKSEKISFWQGKMNSFYRKYAAENVVSKMGKTAIFLQGYVRKNEKQLRII